MGFCRGTGGTSLYSSVWARLESEEGRPEAIRPGLAAAGGGDAVRPSWRLASPAERTFPISSVLVLMTTLFVD